MRQLAAIAALWGCVAMAQAASGVALLEDEVLRRNGTAAPLFSFARPTAFRGYRAYAGLPASDGCYAAASVTGTKGEALTFTRATTRFCPTDGTTNEATGVMCASGEVCIRTLNGKRGIDVFRAGTNLILRSEQLDDAAWTLNNVGAGAASVTANYATAPDGTLTADRLQVAACPTATWFSEIYQNPAASDALGTYSVWLKGNAPNQRISLCDYNSTDSDCDALDLTQTWKRYTHSNPLRGAGGSYLVLGCINQPANYTGASDTGTADVLVWGAMLETGDYASPYVATAGASATRNAEVATFAATNSPGAVFSSAVDVVLPPSWVSTTYAPAVSWRTGAADYTILGQEGTGKGGCESYPSARISRDSVTLATGRYYCYQTSGGALAAGKTAGAFSAAAGNSAVSAAPILLGHWNSTLFLDGLITNVCVDSDPARCR